MSLSLLKTLIRQLVMILSVILILVAAYLSIGRQFMPAVANYRAQVEQRLTEILGVPVSIESLTGYFDGFNPAIEIQGLRFNVLEPDFEADPDRQGLEFERATIVLNVAETIFQRQVVLDNFVIQGLDIAASRTASGNWELSGISLQGQGGGTLDLDLAYDTIQRVDNLELTDLSVELRLNNGNSTRFHDIRANIQNAVGEHFIHVNGVMNDSDEEILLSLELSGDSLADIGGMVHASLPLNDYSSLTDDARIVDVRLGELIGGGQAWVTVEQGAIQSLVVQPRIDYLSFSLQSGTPLVFQNLTGSARLALTDGGPGWELAANDFRFTWNDRLWRSSDSYVDFRPNELLRVRADALDIDILRQMAVASGLAGEDLSQRLREFRPRGMVRNISVQVPLQEPPSGLIHFTANLDNVAIDTVRTTPGLGGVTGYIDLDYDPGQQLLNGFGEVSSENFSIHLARVFNDSWSYDYVNGRLNFRVDTSDGLKWKLASSLIVAESEIVDGRAQFSLDYERDVDDNRSSDLSLLVGALRVDGSKASPYLPSAPNINPGLYRTMEWLDEALLDGAVYQSGVIFRGSTQRGSPQQEKSFQAFFNFNDADVRYIEEWPELSDVTGSVVVSNQNTWIEVESGQTMGLTIGPTSALVGREQGDQLWLSIDGKAAGNSQYGLDFLTSAPLEATLGDTMSDWRAFGEVDATVDLRIPLNVPGMKPRVLINANLQDNRLILPQYQLEFDAINGAINFDSLAGLQESVLTARLFDGDASFALLSQRNEVEQFVTRIDVTGVASVDSLELWPGQSSFVRDILARSEGELQYQAQLLIQQDNTSLNIASNLQGVALNLPQPFQKPADQAMPLNLQIDFGPALIEVDGVLGSELSMRVDVIGAALDGIVYVGTMPGIADPWQPEIDAPGLELRGNLDVFRVSEWLEILSSPETALSPSQDLTRWLSRVRLDVGTLDVFGQDLDSVNVRIEDLQGTDYWTVAMDGGAIAGSVLIPFDADDYIEAYLAYLRLPGADEGGSVEEDVRPGQAVAEPAQVERVDVLAQLDPRAFPKVRFFTGELAIGDRDFGLGRFTMDPGPDGARFSDLIIDFRGFKVGMADDQPSFFWRYDGVDHHSYLTGEILTDDIADVLQANGFAPSLESDNSRFDASLDWPGTPAFLSASDLSGEVLLRVRDGRFLQGGDGPGALKMISVINLDAIMRRLRFSDDLLRRGLAYEEITGDLTLDRGLVTINDQVVINGPSSVYQVTGKIDLAEQTIDGEMYITLPVSDNIPWLGLLGAISGTLTPSLAIGAYLFERIFGEQVDSLTSAQYRLQGPWEGLEPELQQAFGSATNAGEQGNDGDADGQVTGQPQIQ
jgi:uncharacterized protein (TIGR02099 family)